MNISAVQNGDWSDPDTWDNGVPGAGDAVSIESFTVTFDVVSATIQSLFLSLGELIFTGAVIRTLTATSSISLDAGTISFNGSDYTLIAPSINSQPGDIWNAANGAQVLIYAVFSNAGITFNITDSAIFFHGDLPAAADVREGVTYDNGGRVGELEAGGGSTGIIIGE